MASVTVTVGSVKPGDGAIVRRGLAGETLAPGDAVYLDGTNGWKKGDGDAVASAQCRGIVTSDGFGSTSFASGANVDIVRHGPVLGYSGMTPGGSVFVSNTAGRIDQTASVTTGDFVFSIGYAETAEVLYVQPQNTVPVAL